MACIYRTLPLGWLFEALANTAPVDECVAWRGEGYMETNAVAKNVQGRSQPSVVGNADLSSSVEEIIAQTLRERNLQKVNRSAEQVHPRNSVYTKYVKRLLDVLIAVPLFAITLPLNCIFAVCTYFDVGRPIIFRQTRIGKDGTRIILNKFRNMNEKRDDSGHLLPPSQRITKFGRFMRTLSLDELLNFWNVIKGDMSIIGPRPVPVFIYDRMCERHKMRTSVKPGLECPRVIRLDVEKISAWNEELENAIWYVEHVSFATDVKLVFMLFKMTFSIKKRSKSTAGLSYFAGYDDNGNATTAKRYRMDFPDEFLKLNI